MKNYTCYRNRELSWLKFNERVLEEAEDINNPLCERLTFLSIFQSNLDEFFMVRVGSLSDMMLFKSNERENKTNMTAKEQIDALMSEIHTLYKRRDSVYNKLIAVLEEQEVKIINFSNLNDDEVKYFENYFENEIQPLISTYILNQKQPMVFLKNKDIYAVASVSTKNDKEKIAIIPCSNGVFDKLIELPSRKGYYMLTEELILHFIPKLFPKYKVNSKSLIRVTRNADIDADNIFDEDLDYREHMTEVIKRRKKLCPVRLEMTRSLEEDVINKLTEILGLRKNQIFLSESPMDLSFFFKIENDLRRKTELFYNRRVPQLSTQINGSLPMVQQILKKDILLSYPYESINPFLNLLREAAEDPEVVSIKMTLYRLAKNSKIIEALANAADNGKEVIVLVELKARFDEENNIGWSRLLEDSGCHVIYGLDGYKVHSKLCLITRKTDKKLEYITQIGTGNYNEKTAGLYTDFSLMTSDERIGNEASNVFSALVRGEVIEKTEHLLVAPKCLQNKILDMIDKEISIARKGEKGYIGIKVNSLTDKKIIDKLIEASQAGVKIDMIIRGINCLQSGIKDVTDNIHIRSIVGRFLEHSRIYIFGCNGREKIYISSADFMTRNTLRRVEVAVPVYSHENKTHILEMFKVMLADNVKARVQQVDGIYKKIERTKDTPLINSQEFFYEKAYSDYEKMITKSNKNKLLGSFLRFINNGFKLK